MTALAAVLAYLASRAALLLSALAIAVEFSRGRGVSLTRRMLIVAAAWPLALGWLVAAAAWDLGSALRGRFRRAA
ncbi:hypothetical protein [Tianweitania sediminis]|uniref:Uncharacterized protein n=1 Tax=Tianweitania sediminis TaxID=1502156 RepID=A0A8J7R2W9_9HYPH|nr:hypothetical protein [Tianweitania sediminis]MBP0439903.1 hypothetical protein [Tianweitania sediminis]